MIGVALLLAKLAAGAVGIVTSADAHTFWNFGGPIVGSLVVFVTVFLLFLFRTEF